MSQIGEIFLVFLRLGLSSFGGPSAHIAYFRECFVDDKKWLTEEEFADLVALTQFLPGPGSSQMGMGVGWKLGGILGSIAAFLGFTLPSAVLMVWFAIGVMKFGLIDQGEAGWIRGLQIAVVVVIANAVWSMARTLCRGHTRALVALAAAGAALLIHSPFTQVGIIVIGGLLGSAFLRQKIEKGTVYRPTGYRVPNRVGFGATFFPIGCLAVFTLLLVAVPWLVTSGNALLQAFGGMYKSGALVFGGGHVVLPLLSRETVDTGWLSAAEFSAGYGAAQAVPGPLFTISSYLGAMLRTTPGGPWVAALVTTLGLFLPGWLLTLGTLPFWEKLRSITSLQAALAGTNAAVVGLLGAALYDPVWTKSVTGAEDVVFLLGVAALLLVWKLPAWVVVIAAGIVGELCF